MVQWNCDPLKTFLALRNTTAPGAGMRGWSAEEWKSYRK